MKDIKREGVYTLSKNDYTDDYQLWLNQDRHDRLIGSVYFNPRQQKWEAVLNKNAFKNSRTMYGLVVAQGSEQQCIEELWANKLFGEILEFKR